MKRNCLSRWNYYLLRNQPRTWVLTRRATSQETGR